MAKSRNCVGNISFSLGVKPKISILNHPWKYVSDEWKTSKCMKLLDENDGKICLLSLWTWGLRGLIKQEINRRINLATLRCKTEIKTL